MRSIDLSTSVGETVMPFLRASWICSCSVSSCSSTWLRSLARISGVGCRPDVATNSRMRWRRSYSVMIASLTIAATPSAGPVSDWTAAPGGGAAARQAVSAAGGVRFAAGGVRARRLAERRQRTQRAARGRKRRWNRCFWIKARPFGSNLNGLRARPRTGPGE